jgi:ABC-2 type transport system permease protein
MTSMQSFQMIMNFIVMPLYFLSGAMFPMTTAPVWLKSVMAIDPLTYGVDALRNVVFSNTSVLVDGVARPLLEITRQTGLVRWSLGFDLLLVLAVAVAFSALGAWSFSRAQAA